MNGGLVVSVIVAKCTLLESALRRTHCVMHVNAWQDTAVCMIDWYICESTLLAHPLHASQSFPSFLPPHLLSRERVCVEGGHVVHLCVLIIPVQVGSNSADTFCMTFVLAWTLDEFCLNGKRPGA